MTRFVQQYSSNTEIKRKPISDRRSLNIHLYPSKTQKTPFRERILSPGHAHVQDPFTGCEDTVNANKKCAYWQSFYFRFRRAINFYFG